MKTLLTSDNVVLASMATSRRDNVWDRPTYQPPKETSPREGAEDFREYKSLGTQQGQATYPRHHK